MTLVTKGETTIATQVSLAVLPAVEPFFFFPFHLYPATWDCVEDSRWAVLRYLCSVRACVRARGERDGLRLNSWFQISGVRLWQHCEWC